MEHSIARIKLARCLLPKAQAYFASPEGQPALRNGRSTRSIHNRNGPRQMTGAAFLMRGNSRHRAGFTRGETVAVAGISLPSYVDQKDSVPQPLACAVTPCCSRTCPRRRPDPGPSCTWGTRWRGSWHNRGGRRYRTGTPPASHRPP